MNKICVTAKKEAEPLWFCLFYLILNIEVL